jgi:hypothetical protein
MGKYESALLNWGMAADTEISILETKLAECESPTPPTTNNEVGVCLHTNWRTSPYANDDKVSQAVQQLGVTRVRTYLAKNDWWGQAELFRKYRDAGIKVHVTIGAFNDSGDTDKPLFIKSLLAVADCVDSVAGFNEPDAGGLSRSAWLPRAASWHNWLWDAVKSHPDLKHLLVLPGALQGKDDNPDDTKAYADALHGWDRWNAHWYPGNTPNLPAAYLARKAAWPGPTWITEFGGDVSRISQSTAIGNILGVISLHNGEGEAAFIYELLGAGHFGMFDENNFSPTESGKAVTKLLNNGVV